jgi:hypothetical protein
VALSPGIPVLILLFGVSALPHFNTSKANKKAAENFMRIQFRFS